MERKEIKKRDKSKNKATTLIIVSQIVLLIYIIAIGVYGTTNNIKAHLLSYKVDLWVMLLTMFILELGSTLSFQTRIWLTSKERIILAAFIGGLSWLIAGGQGLILINGSIGNFNELITFLIKIPPVFIATFSGILINNFYRKGN